MAVPWEVYDVCDNSIILENIEHPKGFRFLNKHWRNNPEIVAKAVELFADDKYYTDLSYYSLGNRNVISSQGPALKTTQYFNLILSPQLL